MPPTGDDFTPTQIVIVVVVALAGFVLVVTAIALLWRRRKRRSKARVLNPQLRGGGEHDPEVVEYMKSSSLDGTTYGNSELDGSTPPQELGYSTRPRHEVSRALQPGQSNTALPEYPCGNVRMPQFELEDTSRIELPPDKSDENLRPGPLNFSRPSGDNTELKRDTTEEHEDREHVCGSGLVGILKNADEKPAHHHRVSSPTIPIVLQDTSTEDEVSEQVMSPVSPLTVSGSVRTQGDRPRRVSFMSEVSTIRPPVMRRSSDVS